MRPIRVLPFAAALLAVTACNGLKEALTAHVDVVARAGSQELSVKRLGDLLGNAQIQVPVTREPAASWPPATRSATNCAGCCSTGRTRRAKHQAPSIKSQTKSKYQ